MIEIYEAIEKTPGVAVRKDELLSLHTTLGVGGPCDLMVWVSDLGGLRKVLEETCAETVPVMVLGAGSNVLVRDGGIEGMVLRLAGEFAHIEVESPGMSAGAGANLAAVVSEATAAGIGGLEFLSGIPGTLGGAVAGNAGSGSEWISERLTEVRFLNAGLVEISAEPEDLGFGYRSSNMPPGHIITGASIEGLPTDVESVRNMVEERLEKRRATQPVGEKTAGCVFKNIGSEPAGKLIENAGLKGLRVGGAQVSNVHANYIVNTGGATAREVLDLIQIMRTRVADSYGVDLELEIKIIGRH